MLVREFPCEVIDATDMPLTRIAPSPSTPPCICMFVIVMPVMPPTSWLIGPPGAEVVRPGMSCASAVYCLPVGIVSRTSRVMTRAWLTFWTSTSGLAPDTVTVSWTLPTRSSTLTFAVNPAVSSMPSRLIVVNPASE